MENWKLHMGWAVLAIVLGMVASTFAPRQRAAATVMPSGRVSAWSAGGLGSGNSPEDFENTIEKLEDEVSRLRDSQSGGFGNPLANRPPAVAFMYENGRLTTAATEELHLSAAQVQSVNRTFHETNIAMGKLIGAAMLLNETESKPNEQIAVYDIPPMPDEGGALLDDFQNQLTKLLGAEKANRVYAMFKSSPSTQLIYGGYGKYPLKITLQSFPTSGERHVEWSYHDPIDGTRMRGGKHASEASFRESFGAIPLPK